MMNAVHLDAQQPMAVAYLKVLDLVKLILIAAMGRSATMTLIMTMVRDRARRSIKSYGQTTIAFKISASAPPSPHICASKKIQKKPQHATCANVGNSARNINLIGIFALYQRAQLIRLFHFAEK